MLDGTNLAPARDVAGLRGRRDPSSQKGLRHDSDEPRMRLVPNNPACMVPNPGPERRVASPANLLDTISGNPCGVGN